jgi:hypothetical protein
MLICMRTTLNLDDELIREVKQRAARSGQTMTELIETCLRRSLAPPPPSRRPFKLRWPTVKGRVLPGIDLADRDALYERMEGRG